MDVLPFVRRNFYEGALYQKRGQAGEDEKADSVLLGAGENFLEQGSYNEVRSKKDLANQNANH